LGLGLLHALLCAGVWLPIAIGFPGGPGAGHKVLKPPSGPTITMKDVGRIFGSAPMPFHMDSVKLAIGQYWVMRDNTGLCHCCGE